MALCMGWCVTSPTSTYFHERTGACEESRRQFVIFVVILWNSCRPVAANKYSPLSWADNSDPGL